MTNEAITIVEHRDVTISPRATLLTSILARIADGNDAGQRPSKADLSRGLASAARARTYKAIDRLIAMGLVVSDSGSSTYALVVTDAGRRIVDGERTVTVEVEHTVPVARTWTVTEHITDGARFVWHPHIDRDAALAEAADRIAAGTEHLEAVTVTESVIPKVHVATSLVPQPTTTVVWERGS